jgi:hypothetical protein
MASQAASPTGWFDPRADRWRSLPLARCWSALVVGGLILMATRAQDRLAAEKSVALVQSVLAVEQRNLARTATDYAWWQEAYENLAENPNRDWASTNIGAHLYDNFDISGSFVLDPSYARSSLSAAASRSRSPPAANSAGRLRHLRRRSRALQALSSVIADGNGISDHRLRRLLGRPLGEVLSHTAISRLSGVQLGSELSQRDLNERATQKRDGPYPPWRRPCSPFGLDLLSIGRRRSSRR